VAARFFCGKAGLISGRNHAYQGLLFLSYMHLFTFFKPPFLATEMFTG